MGEEPAKEEQAASVPLRHYAIPTPSGINLFYELWETRSRFGLWRIIYLSTGDRAMISDKGELRAKMAAHILGAHVVRGQQADVHVRAQQALDEADNILALIEAQEKAERQPNTFATGGVVDPAAVKSGGGKTDPVGSGG